jgi:hypothetical protein
MTKLDWKIFNPQKYIHRLPFPFAYQLTKRPSWMISREGI